MRRCRHRRVASRTSVATATRYDASPWKPGGLLARAVKTLKASDVDRPLAEGPGAHRGRGSADARPRRRTRARDEIAGQATGVAFEALIARRATGEPIPYIKGYAEFRGLELRTKPGVFVPRDSSEFLAEQAVRRLRGARSRCTSTWRPAAARSPSRSPTRCRRPRCGAPTSRPTRSSSRGRTPRRSDLTRDVRAGRSVRRAAEVAPGRGRRHHAASAVRGRAARSTTCPTRSATGNPSTPSPTAASTASGLIHRTVDESPRGSGRGGWLLMEVSPDRAKGVKKVFRHGGFRGRREHEGRRAQGDPGHRRAAAEMTEPTSRRSGSWRRRSAPSMLVERAASASAEVWLEDGVAYWLESRPVRAGPRRS